MLTLLYGIESAPFEISEKGIGEIPSDLGQFLYEEIESFNETRKGKNLKD
jgi:transcription initiation factor IIF auxiliary subunit